MEKINYLKRNTEYKGMEILSPRTICYTCPEKAEILHNSVPLCRKCDCRVRKHKGLPTLPKKYYKTEEQIEKEYKSYWENIRSVREEKERIKNESRQRTKHLKKDYCEKCGGTEKLEFHHFDYIKDKGETLCFECHKKEQALVIEKNEFYDTDVENLARERLNLTKERIEERQKKRKEIEKANRKKREDTLKLVEKCFVCGVETILKRQNIPICIKCNNKIEKKLRGRVGIVI